MTNNNQVNWDEIPEDVEAVLTYGITESTFFKKEGGKLYSQLWRHSIYKKSGWDEYNEVSEYYGDRFHLRPSPIIEPTPETPESTQVETSEVKATTAPEFDWSSVDDDVEVVFLHGEGHGQWQQWYKTVEGRVMVRYPPEGVYMESLYTTLLERINDADAVSKCYIRPPATPPPEDIGLNAAYDVYKKVAAEVDKINNDIYKEAAINFKPDADMYDIFKGVDSKPSISTILKEAQQSILKYHGVTGEVKFTVTCSE